MQPHAAAAGLQDWLYDKGEDESKTVYVNKLKELEALGEPVLARAREAGARPRATAALMTTANRMIQIASANDAKHAHIPQEDKERQDTAGTINLQWCRCLPMTSATPAVCKSRHNSGGPAWALDTHRGSATEMDA